MKYGKRLLSILLIGILCMGGTFQSQASEIQKQKNKKEELQKEKNAAQQKQSSLTKKLKSVVSEMEKTEAKITKKENELEAKEEELMQAKVDENDQYEAMKKRIKYMYENGNTQMIEILFESKSIGELLNRVEYISTISEYDREKLSEFQDAVKEVGEQERAIKEEYEELETLQSSLITKEQEVKTMLEENSEELQKLAKQLKSTTKKLDSLVKAAKDAERKQTEASSGYQSNAGDSVVSGNGKFAHPCPGYSRISSYFGYRDAPLAGASTNHKGVDFAAPQGTPIYAADAGTVVQACYSGKAGNFIIINHGDGTSTYYMHCYQMYVKAGEKVSRGQNIGSVGTTGNSTGPHLHFQVMQNGVPVNPLSFL